MSMSYITLLGRSAYMAEWWKNKIFGVCISAILDIAKHFDINPDDLYSQKRGFPLEDLRHVLIYIMIVHYGLNRTEVMGLFGRERSTSYNSIEKVHALLLTKDVQVVAFYNVSLETFNNYFSLN